MKMARKERVLCHDSVSLEDSRLANKVRTQWEGRVCPYLYLVNYTTAFNEGLYQTYWG